MKIVKSLKDSVLLLKQLKSKKKELREDFFGVLLSKLEASLLEIYVNW